MKKGALIGCGFFARNHMHAWADVEGAAITALCDRDENRLKETADRFGVERTYTDAADLLKSEELDFVDIATTVQTHRPLVELAAGSRVHIICQKPFADAMEDGKAMIDAAASAGVTLMVHENFRWQSAIRAAKAELDKGSIGMPFWGRVSFRSAYDVYSGQPYLATDDRFIIQDLGIHILDIARFLFGDAHTISASTKRVNPAIRAEDVATMMLVHESGVTSVVDCSYASRLPRESFPESLLEVDGSEGTLRLMPGYRLVLHNASGTRELDVSPPLLSWAARPWHNIQESVYNIQRHFIDCLNASSAPETSGLDNLNTLELVEAAYLSAAENSRTIKLDTA
ncbi:Gfo/Idh/MocA family protein [Roseibium album]|uniref:1,5-anhydro-D-fructose reductase n=1 Tax=Roseibium album TaxID=311410 RepID=A0A0M7B0D0_9HYPH|nr:Gfo/Idh/MocA family oxidoreductase [Roseibium album]CTQ63369.1 1,5-anhydro-D-fructose reductase [Roseibium album]CTQ79413.1 1,5-anhydro-D-fructose reductase [Roseibium album]CTQ80956.1 1,5-anhydro-D-fructose reductase [Roseibium album]